MSSTISRLVLLSITLMMVLGLQISSVPGASLSPDFAISVSPSSITIPITGSVPVQVTLTSLGSFSGQVNITASSAPTSDPQLILGAPSLQLAARGTAGTSLNITIDSNVYYTVTVVGTSGVLTHSATVNVAPGAPQTDFMVTTNKGQLTTPRTLPDNALITVTSLHLFVGTISMTGAVNPAIANGPSVSYSPESFPVSNWGSGSTTLTVQTTSLTPLQNYTILISASGQTYDGSTTHSIKLNLTVANSGFEISANPPSFDTGTTDSDGTVIRVVSTNGFAGNVTLSASVNPKAPGVYIPVTVRMFPDNLTLSPNGEEDSLLIATVSGSIVDSYDITVVVSDGPLVRSLVVTFQVDAAQYRSYRTIDYLSVTTGATNNLLINVLNQTSYLGPVSLNATVFPKNPEGLAISFQPPSLGLTSLGWNTTEMTVKTQPNTPLGVYIVFLSESSGTMRLSPLAVILTVEVPIQFNMTVSPSSFILGAGMGIADSQLSITNLDNRPGQVAVTTSYNATAFTVVVWRNPSLYYIENNPLDLSNQSTTVLSVEVTANTNADTGNYTVVITGTSGNITRSTLINISVINLSSDFLEYSVIRVGDPNPGAVIQLVYNFTDIGQLSMTVLEVQLQAFNRTYLQITNPVALTGGEEKTVTTTLEIPNTVRPGLQFLSFYIQWEFYNPISSQWVTANPIDLYGNITIPAPPAPPPAQPPLPPTTPTQGPTGPSSVFTVLVQTFRNLASQVMNGQIIMPLFDTLFQETALIVAAAVCACLLLLAVLLSLKQGRRMRT